MGRPFRSVGANKVLWQSQHWLKGRQEEARDYSHSEAALCFEKWPQGDAGADFFKPYSEICVFVCPCVFGN